MNWGFKDQISADIEVFINFDEFGEMKVIDDLEVLVVVDGDVFSGRDLLRSIGQQSMYAEGVFAADITFFVRESDLGYRPVEGQLMKFDGRPYIVSRVSAQMGILEIGLGGNAT